MTLIADASVALKWVVDELGSSEAVALLDETLIAPSLWLIETGNALWARVADGRLDVEQVLALQARLYRSPVRTVEVDPPLMTEALRIAADLRHPIYDCVYLALARRERATLVTDDRRFITAVRRSAALSPLVRPLRE